MSSNVKTNLEGLKFMINREKYYSEIIQSIQQSAKYKKNNKIYSFIFKDLDTGRKYRLNSDDIYLAKNKIFTYDLYKDYIRKLLYDNNYTNVNVICKKNTCGTFYKNMGYNNVTNDNLEKYINKNTNIYMTLNLFNSKKDVYSKYYKMYFEACYYFSYIRSKINNLINTKSQSKVYRISIILNKNIFPNIETAEIKKIYNGKELFDKYKNIL